MTERQQSTASEPTGSKSRDRRSLWYALAGIMGGLVAWWLLSVASETQAESAEDGSHWVGRSPWFWAAAIVAIASLVATSRAFTTNPGTAARGISRASTILAGLASVILIAGAIASAGVVLVTMGTQSTEGRPRRRHSSHRTNGSVCPDGTKRHLDDTADAESSNVALELRATWERAAHFEAEAVEAFVDLEAELASLGAPDRLTDWAAQAAREETEHARACQEIAASFGSSLRRGPLPMAHGHAPRTRRRAPRSRLGRRSRIAKLAVESYLGGCCNEGAEVARLTLAAERSDPALASQIQGIARQEQSHAELAWATVAWAIDEVGPSLTWGLRSVRFRRSVPMTTTRPTSRESLDPSTLERGGWLSPTERAACVREARSAARRQLSAWSTHR